MIEWVLGHKGVAGIEKADLLAKVAVQLPNIIETALSATDIKTLISRHYNKAWQQQWSNSGSRLLDVKQSIGFSAYQDLPRRQQVAMFRLRLGTCKLTHGYILRNSEPL